MRAVTPPIARLARIAVALAVALTCVACDARRRLPRPLADYLAAIEDHTVAVDDGPAVLDGLPRPRERRVDIPDGPTLNVRDLFDVHGCGLGAVVGRRNNALGRVMTFSQRALYTLRFMAVAEGCLPALEPPLRATLEAALDHKRRHLPADVFNAVWAGREVAILLSVADGPFDAGAADGAARAVTALTTVVAALRAREPADLEGALGPLQRARAAGAALRRLEHARYVLEAVAARLDGLPTAACADRGAALKAAFDRHYVGRVQPMLAEDDRGIRPLLTGLDRLYRQTTDGLDPPPALAAFHRAYLVEDDGLRARHRAALRTHAAAWQRLFARCGLPAIGG